MQRSKSLALMFILGAVLVGGVLGFTADRVFARDEACQRSDKRGSRDRFAAELGLSDEQRAMVDTLLDAKHAQMAEVMAPIRPRLDSISATTRSQIARILTDDQRPRFERMHEEMKTRNKTRER